MENRHDGAEILQMRAVYYCLAENRRLDYVVPASLSSHALADIRHIRRAVVIHKFASRVDKKDIAFITEFTRRMADAAVCPVGRTMPEKVRKELDEYMNRKREDE